MMSASLWGDFQDKTMVLFDDDASKAMGDLQDKTMVLFSYLVNDFMSVELVTKEPNECHRFATKRKLTIFFSRKLHFKMFNF